MNRVHTSVHAAFFHRIRLLPQYSVKRIFHLDKR